MNILNCRDQGSTVGAKQKLNHTLIYVLKRYIGTFVYNLWIHLNIYCCYPFSYQHWGRYD
jgi:hypothetical protein